MSVVHLARPELRELRAYSAADQVDNTIRLNANESPLANPAGQFRRPLNRYPEVRPSRLTNTLAERFNCSAKELLVTRGSSEAIDLIIRSFCRAGIDSIVTPSPSFSMYKHYATIQDAGFVEVPTQSERDFEIDVDALLEACRPTTKVMFVCSPNNPTGTPMRQSDIVRLLSARSESSIVVVDEAYIEFGDQNSATTLLQKFPNLLVLRTLSKALGFAGVRCGAVIGNSELINLLTVVQSPYALATPVVECVEDALDESFAARSSAMVAEVVDERDRLSRAIQAFTYVDKVWPSTANFLLVRFQNGDAVADYCEQQQILVRNFGKELPNCVRITVGSVTENDALLDVLSNYDKELL